MSQQVIEIVQYKTTNPELAKETMLSQSQKLDNYLTQVDGFIKRDVSFNEEEKHWVEVVYWQSMNAAKSAAENIMQQPFIGEFMQLIDENSIKMSHQTIL